MFVWLRKIVLIILILGLLAYMVVTFLGWYFAGSSYKGPRTAHFDGRYFSNIEPTPKKSFWTVLKWQMNRDYAPWVFQDIDKTQIKQDRVDANTLCITPIFHATVLIQTNGVNILTDPIWSERPSPVAWAGPPRAYVPPVALEDLPPIDYVVISHNHYDHMDIPTLLALKKKDNPLVITGLGNAPYLRQQGLDKVETLDWWQQSADAVRYL